jgi:hypothetical protein
MNNIYKCSSYLTGNNYVSITTEMLFREANAVNCENQRKHTNTPCRPNAGFQYIEAGGTCRTTRFEEANADCHEIMINEYEHTENG